MAALALSLAGAAAQAPDWAFCSGCGLMYFGDSKPRQNERRFCPACKTGRIDVKLQKRKSRAR